MTRGYPRRAPAVDFPRDVPHETNLTIRPATEADGPAIWRILEPILREGEAYALDRDMDETEALAFWAAPDRTVFVAEQDGEVVGTYYLRPNQMGGGRHVCNCGYGVARHAMGRGVARAMGLHSLDEGRRQGYRAMQFNFVVSSNVRAVRLWESLGFSVVGRLPGAFVHPALGPVDALVMFREL